MGEIIKSTRLGESYQKINHPSGLTIILCPMEGFSTAYALFATKYGSVDTCFKTDGEEDFTKVPEGIAHFLEHKLFESEDGDAFIRYAKTGASANAYTSFDRTAYLFSCSENFPESIEILIDFVTHPYFTQQTVEKEQGIIGQEIKMYDDSASWRVFFNLLGALYHNNPVKIDIAGTVASIAKIDAELLYSCYNTFYNLNNMVLVVAGNFTPQVVLDTADNILKPAKQQTITRASVDEPREIVTARVVQKLPVALPLFNIGFKRDASESEAENGRGQIYDEVLLDILAGEASPLYRKLYDSGLINQSFGCEPMAGRDYAMLMISGESRDPDAVYKEIMIEIERLKKDRIAKRDFEICKKAFYGKYIGMYGRADSIAGLIVTAHFSEIEPYSLLDIIADMTIEDIEKRLDESLDATRCAISIVEAGN